MLWSRGSRVMESRISFGPYESFPSRSPPSVGYARRCTSRVDSRAARRPRTVSSSSACGVPFRGARGRNGDQSLRDVRHPPLASTPLLRRREPCKICALKCVSDMYYAERANLGSLVYRMPPLRVVLSEKQPTLDPGVLCLDWGRLEAAETRQA